VGRAVIREAPSVLLLDNALSHLDAQQRLEARVEVSRLHHDIGCTVVSVTHDQAEALAVGTRIAVLDDGVLQQVGTPHDLYERPGNSFVAGFIGDPPMNLVRVRVDRRDGQDVLRTDALELPLPGPIAGAEVVVGFRPQDVQLAPAGDDVAGGFLGRCELVEHLGADCLVHLRVGAHEVIARDHRVSEIRVGEMVGASVPVTRLHLFDAATGVAIA